MSVSKSQRGVALGMATGLAITLAGLAATVLFSPLTVPQNTAGARVWVFALCALAPALSLAAAIARLAAHRFLTPQDIDGSGLVSGTERARLLQAILQNTLEQLALAIPVYAAWATLAPFHWIAALPVAATLFLIGRMLFSWGYARGAPGRALGFALTFYPTVVLLAGTIIMGLRVVGG